MERHGVKVPAGEPATNLDEAKTAIAKLFDEGNARVVIKSQIHAGGRGKGTFKAVSYTHLTLPTIYSV